MRLGREAADEDEREVARVREARLVERQRLREVPLVHRGGVSGCRRGLFRLSAASIVWSNTTSGLAIWFASSACACDAIAANAVGSARGCVKRR